MIKGQFVSVASPGELKKRFGKGFRVNVRCDLENEAEVTEIVKNCFGSKVGVEKI